MNEQGGALEVNGSKHRVRGFVLHGFLGLVVFAFGFQEVLGQGNDTRQRRVSHRDDVSSNLHQLLADNDSSYAAGEDYPDFSMVGALLSKSSGWMGTATLVSPGCILTAAHVVWNDAYSPAPDPADWEFVVGNDFEAAGAQKYDVASIHVHPGWLACMVNNDGDLKGFDIALIQLASSVSNVTPALINASYDESSSIGQTIYFAGVGALGDGINGVSFPDNSRRFAGANVLDRVNSEVSHGLSSLLYSGGKGGVLGFDFDSPTGSDNSLDGSIFYGRLGSGSSDPMPIPLEATSASGDSGGPVFARLGESWRLVGVSSYGTTNSIDGDVAVFTRAANHAEWIFSYLEAWPTAAWSGLDSWRTSSWFGSFSVAADNWIFHQQHGWLYAPGGGDDTDDLWLWSNQLGWTWTNQKSYPYLYSVSKGNWLYFWSNYSTLGRRYFYDFNTDTLLLYE